MKQITHLFTFNDFREFVMNHREGSRIDMDDYDDEDCGCVMVHYGNHIIKDKLNLEGKVEWCTVDRIFCVDNAKKTDIHIRPEYKEHAKFYAFMQYILKLYEGKKRMVTYKLLKTKLKKFEKDYKP